MSAPEISGNLAERPILEVVRALHSGGATGVLEVDSAGHRRRLHFRDGELFLPGNHPLARLLAEQVEEVRGSHGGGASPGDAAREDKRRRLLDLVSRIAGVILDWRDGVFRFQIGAAGLPADLVGPLPTRRLLMVASTRGVEDAELARRFGGEDVRLVSVGEPQKGGDLLGLTPEEMWLLERLRGPMAVADLLRESPLPAEAVHLHLAQLNTVGLVAPAPERTARPPTEGDVDAEVINRLGDRLARELAEEPIGFEPETHRAMVADLLARVGGVNYYELLEIPPSAPGEEVHAAYERLARLVHPANARRLEIEGKEEALRILFEQATRAYLVLSDPERRRVYNQRQLIELAATERTGAERQTERRELARQHFERAATLAAASEFHFAIELLQEASRIDPRSEYLVALGRLQERNPNWRRRAVESYRSALELDPDSAEVRFALGRLYEELEELDRARVQYAATVRLRPHHHEAAERLAKLMEGRGKGAGGGGLFDRIFRRT